MERALELEPRSAVGHANLALLLVQATQWREARTEALNALRFANNDPAVALAAGTVLEASNWGEDAVDAYAQALRSEINGAASEVQVHRTGILYYRRIFYRGSPSTILLPGEWQQAVPGRYARAQEALTRWMGASD